jgi:hypothetical protein
LNLNEAVVNFFIQKLNFLKTATFCCIMGHYSFFHQYLDGLLAASACTVYTCALLAKEKRAGIHHRCWRRAY